MNPFQLKPEKETEAFMDWQQLYPRSYDKRAVDPYTRVRVILMNGTEFESAGYSHQFQRHESNNDLRRELSMLRRQEQQQQKKIACLKPMDETILEHTIGYEQLAVDLTAALAQREPDRNVKAALDFALLEDFDHLYRYADLMDLESGRRAEHLVGGYTEIMPGRPTISEHRDPRDSIRAHIDARTAAPETKLCVNIITAAEQQTMNYYMNTAAAYPTELGRRLYQEIGMIEEQHVSHYGSLIDPGQTWLECLVGHEFTECYLYWSCFETETDPRIRKLWQMLLEQEISHLHAAARLLERVENTSWQAVAGDGEFPAPLALTSNIDYVRGVLASSVRNTALRERYVDVERMDPRADFFAYQETVNHDVKAVPSHVVIEREIAAMGRDYRFEVAPGPVPELTDPARDNTTLGRAPAKEPSLPR